MKRKWANFKRVFSFRIDKINLILMISTALIISACKGGDVDVNSIFNDTSTQTADVGNGAIKLFYSGSEAASVSFGNPGPPPASTTKVLTLKNTSSFVVYFGSISISTSAFSITSTTCAIGTAFAPSSTCDVTVQFQPTTGGAHSVSLSTTYGLSAAANTTVAALFGLTGDANPAAPSNFTAGVVTGTTISFSWTDNASNETGYEVERCDGTTCSATFVTAATQAIVADSTSYTWTGLTLGQHYVFRIRATTGASQSDWLQGSLQVAFGGISTVENGAGTHALFSSIDCDTTGEGVYVGLDWTGIASAQSYLVYNRTGGTATLLATLSSATTSYILTGLTANQAYDLSVEVLTTSGATSTTNVSSLTTTYVAPCVSVGQPAPNQLDLTDGFYNVQGMSDNGTKFAVADVSNNRVLIWNSKPTSNNVKPDVVLGQPNFYDLKADNNGTTSSIGPNTLEGPRDVAFCPTSGQFFVADYGNHRVLMWNTVPTTNHAPANVVFGQDDMYSATAGTTSDRLRNPYSVWCDDTAGAGNERIYISDYSNHRVLVFVGIPSSNRPSADFVLGQPNMTSSTLNNGGLDASSLRNPTDVIVASNKLIVADRANHRVKIYNNASAIAADNIDADNVIGQPNWGTAGGNQGGRDAGSLNNPYFIDSDGTKLAVADYSNHRVLVWNTIPTTDNADADVVLGQTAFNAASAGTNTTRFNAPISVNWMGTDLFISDYSNRRILRRINYATGYGPHDNILGQPSDYLTNTINNSGLAANTLRQPRGVKTDPSQPAGSQKLVVADYYNHRVLIWNNLPTTYRQNADVVVGQVDKTSRGYNIGNTNSPTPITLYYPEGVSILSNYLAIADRSNNRVMLWNTIPTADGTAADVVLGQTTMYTRNANAGGLSASSLNAPADVTMCGDGTQAGTKLLISDRGNRRVLIWNTMPTANNTAADLVIGQPADNTNGANQGGISKATMYDPYAVHCDENSVKVYVADYNNHRVLVWNTFPTVTGQAADFVLGQPNGTSNTADNGGLSAKALQNPFGVSSYGNTVMVSDYSNHRILIWKNGITSDFQNASVVLGQGGSFSTQTANKNGASVDSVWNPTDVFTPDGLRVFFSDFYNNRVIARPIP